MNNYNDTNWYFRNQYKEFQNPMEMNQNLYNPKEGFVKGNLFTNLYEEYKNMKPMNLNPKTPYEKELLDIQALCFAINDLQLYLDIHPEDTSMITLLNDYRLKKEKMQKQFEEQFGPLTIDSDEMNSNTFQWENSPWPWEENNV